MKLKTAAQKLGSLGGKARAKRLSAERRKEIASLGGIARAVSVLAAKRISLNFEVIRMSDKMGAAFQKLTEAQKNIKKRKTGSHS